MVDYMLDRNDPRVLGAKQAASAGSPVDAMLDAIVERLRQRLVPSIDAVERFRNRQKQYDLGEKNAAVIVLADRVRFGSEGMRGAAGLAREVSIICVLLMRILDDAPGREHALLEEIRLALHGESFAGSTGLVPTEQEFDDEDGTAHLFHLTFTASLPAVPVKSQRNGAPLRLTAP